MVELLMEVVATIVVVFDEGFIVLVVASGCNGFMKL
jgi:hypothetical protein